MPHDLNKQLDLNRQQIEQRIAMGDKLATPRPVDHSAEFKKRKSADTAGDELRALGYQVTIGKRGLLKVLLEATKLSAVDAVTAEAFTREVIGVVEKHGGDYDGWGGPVEQ